MNKQLIFIPGLFVLGILVGIFMMKSHQQDVSAVETPQPAVTPGANTVAATDNNAPTDLSMTEQRLANMEAALFDIQNRLDMLESVNPQPNRADSKRARMSEFASVVDTPITASTRAINVDSLVLAGIDPATADDLVRKKSELELDKLELRDKASREGYLGTRQYMDELQELVEADISLRDELGDDAYDRYLYNSGQANRVRVASVMLGSAAEQAGMKQGDLILSYGEQRLFDWHELQSATAEGERNEYVNVIVSRNGNETIMWLPRGPLGVRLTSTRLNPDL